MSSPLLAGALLVSCSRNSNAEVPLPDGNKLLRDSADAMSHVTSAHFSLTVLGDLRAVPVSSAQGVAARQGPVGQASLTATITGQSGQVRYILTDGNAYLGVNDSWQRVPLANFDPSLFLDANQGMPSTLGRATDGHTEGSESVNNTPCYKVRATVPTDLLRQLAIATPEETTPATLWITKNGDRFLKGYFNLQSVGASGPTEITLLLSNLNEPVSIKAPSVP